MLWQEARNTALNEHQTALVAAEEAFLIEQNESYQNSEDTFENELRVYAKSLLESQ